jgi:uncharacterized protein YjbI with pentapeptide repeats
LNGADLSRGNFNNGDFSFSEARSEFNHATLIGANMFGADFCGADFTQADLRDADMTDSKIARATFTYTKLEGSIRANGRPWGFSVKAPHSRKAWWKVWDSAAV